MAVNKAAYVNSYGSKAYKNSYYKQITYTDIDNERADLRNIIRIPNIANLQDGVFSKLIEQADGSYYSSDYTETDDFTQIIDFGDNPVTFFVTNRDLGDIKLGTNIDDEIYYWQDGPDGERILARDKFNVNMEMYGLCAPYGNVISGVSGENIYTNCSYISYSPYFGDTLFRLKTELIAKAIGGTKMYSLAYKKNTDFVQTSEFINIGLYPRNADTLPIRGGNLHKGGVGIFGEYYPSLDDRYYYYTATAHYGTYTEESNRLACTMNIDFSSGGTGASTGYFYLQNSDGDFGIKLTKRDPDNALYQNSLISFCLLCDDDNNIYVLSLMSIPVDYKKDGSLNRRATYRIVVNKLSSSMGRKIKKTSYINKNDDNRLVSFYVLERTDDYDLSTVTDVNATVLQLLGELIDVDKIADYSGDAPDAYGPGDAYSQQINSNSSVGGHSTYDPETGTYNDEINTSEATPNNNYNTFDYESSLFGTYVMSNQNLKDYTYTLQMLYDHSSDILFGGVAKQFAEQIKEGTTSVNCLPVNIPSDHYSSEVFGIGNVGIASTSTTWSQYIVGTYTNANYLTNNMLEYTIDMAPIKHRYDNFLDFAPYSSASIYIPYIGPQELPLNLIQSTSVYTKTLSLKIRIDIPTGDFVIILFSEGVPLTHWNGNCARSIPIAINDDSSIIRGITNSIVSSAATGNAAGMVTATLLNQPSGPCQHMVGNIQNSGISGWLDNKDIYITVERPNMYLPYGYGNNTGFPTYKTIKIGSASGFCKFERIHLKCNATDDEKELILKQLEEGVIL